MHLMANCPGVRLKAGSNIKKVVILSIYTPVKWTNAKYPDLWNIPARKKVVRDVLPYCLVCTGWLFSYTTKAYYFCGKLPRTTYTSINLVMLSINGLRASIEGKEILKGINLEVKPGEVHAIMGPNGSGKSTLASVLAGREEYEVTGGNVTFQGKDLLELAAEQRAAEGIFLAFQYPVEIPGVTTINFLKTAVNEIRKYNGEEPLDAARFLKMVREKAKLVSMNDSLLKRALNEGFSGGEKKRNEIFQMAVLEPKLAILDETDSGLDIDALRIVAEGVNSLRSPDRSTIVVTHYQRLLDYIVPDYVHVLYKGRIVKSGPKELAFELEEKGYDWIKAEVEAEEVNQ
jgi:Fe-S cluster assembly ATP-binding protein